ncbi:hypothetical protein NS226_03000 [Aureimonas ureilytica]|uniref:O-antigen ligase-related domain-containing protein n=1 Tax=Aureimonas ureilytica TaxID=401562 RepID=A0A175RBB5_9HYPH|nr:O-antigen ligase family protein [Aureimonas ureilytica]KTQ97649.1 hypothetical protein NS226_03000 [Aureimonas ureilytica]
MTMMGRTLLLRRRIDPFILGGGVFLLGLMLGAGKVAFLFFALCGLYLALIRHRACRSAPAFFSGLLLAWSLWQIGLSLLRGEPVSGNRVLSYAAIELAFVFFPIGLCLVRRPADALATGARLALLALLVATPINYVMVGDRVGLGANEALFAFVAGVVGLAARLPAVRPWRWLPNGAGWTYLSIVPILLSGTRAALVVVVFAAFVDVLRTIGAGRFRVSWKLAAAAALGLVLLAYPASRMLSERFESGVSELQNFEATGDVTGSVDVRLVMWKSASLVIGEHPLIGVGGTHKMEAAGEKAGRNAYMVTYYQHLHNFVLDEAISSGLVGLGLMLSVFASFLVTVFRRTASRGLREVSCLLVAFLVSFGSFHGVLLNEWTLIVLFGTMGTVLATIARQRHFRPESDREGTR